jgi:hypothetical protein
MPGRARRRHRREPLTRKQWLTTVAGGPGGPEETLESLNAGDLTVTRDHRLLLEFTSRPYLG